MLSSEHRMLHSLAMPAAFGWIRGAGCAAAYRNIQIDNFNSAAHGIQHQQLVHTYIVRSGTFNFTSRV